MRCAAIGLAALLAACAGPREAAFRDRAREALRRDAVSGGVEARRIVIEHRHVPEHVARLVELRWAIDGVEQGHARWDDSAPEGARTLVAALVSSGAHTITIETRYRLYTCCYACGFFQTWTMRTERRVEIAGDARLCFRTGGRARVTDPVDEYLPARPVACE